MLNRVLCLLFPVLPGTVPADIILIISDSLSATCGISAERGWRNGGESVNINLALDFFGYRCFVKRWNQVNCRRNILVRDGLAMLQAAGVVQFPSSESGACRVLRHAAPRNDKHFLERVIHGRQIK